LNLTRCVFFERPSHGHAVHLGALSLSSRSLRISLCANSHSAGQQQELSRPPMGFLFVFEFFFSYSFCSVWPTTATAVALRWFKWIYFRVRIGGYIIYSCARAKIRITPHTPIYIYIYVYIYKQTSLSAVFFYFAFCNWRQADALETWKSHLCWKSDKRET